LATSGDRKLAIDKRGARRDALRTRIMAKGAKVVDSGALWMGSYSKWVRPY